MSFWKDKKVVYGPTPEETWKKISELPSLTEAFIRNYRYNLDWDLVSSRSILSEEFIREFKDEVNWYLISKYQKLSEEFIREFKDKVDWHYISKHQDISEEFMNKFSSYYLATKGRRVRMNIKIKRLNKHAVIPTYAHLTDAGLDLTATSIEDKGDIVIYGTGLAIEIPEGYVGFIYPRSSVYRTSLSLANSVGVIDSGYRGELKVAFRNHDGDKSLRYSLHQRVAQLVIVPYPRITFQEVEQLSESLRDIKGFGSTGK